MADRLVLESAIIVAEGHAAVFRVVMEALMRSNGEDWKELGLKPHEGRKVVVFDNEEWIALDRAQIEVREAIKGMSRAFYGGDYTPP